MGGLRRKKNSAMLHGNALGIRMVQMGLKKGFPKTTQTIHVNCFQCFSDPIQNAPVPNGHMSKRTPRCMGAYFFRFVQTNDRKWVPQKSPKPFVLNGLERLSVFLVWSGGPAGRPARTHGRTDARTHAGPASDPPPTRTGKKYAVRGIPPHSDICINTHADSTVYALRL